MELVLVCVLLSLGCYAANTLEPKSTPAYIIKGTFSGEIWICPLHTPTQCELFHKGNSLVTDTIVRGEYLYASHDDGVILMCNWYKKKRCTVFYRGSTNVNSLVAIDSFLYAGDDNGTILRCELTQPHSCTKAHTISDTVNGLYKYDKYIYAVGSGYLIRCPKGMEDDCVQIENVPIMGPVAVSGWKNTVIIMSMFGYAWTHVRNSLTRKGIIRFDDTSSHFYDMKVFKGDMYVLQEHGDTSILICKWDDETNKCTNFVRKVGIVRSISFVYETYHVQSSYLGNGCGWQSSPMVFNYEEENRALLEASVVSGKLCDARGTLVDTRNADQGYSGRVAVFAMGPDGQLLLSYAHQSGLVHITSLFAGNPVAGAGEMVVEDGVIRKIVACSVSYRADVGLNSQVVDELYSRGYTEEIELEECAYTCDRD